MLNFKDIEIDDFNILKPFLQESGELSCENNFVNLLIWQKPYKNQYAVCDGQLILKSSNDGNDLFQIPLGDNLQKGMALIREYCGKKPITFWTQEGVRLDEFKRLFNNEFEFFQVRENFDYIYSSEDLAYLKGKKFHSKRNHINAFDKKYDWHYEAISDENLSQIKTCAESWYLENSSKIDELMQFEKKGVDTILDNLNFLEAKGGAIFVGEKVVAFTLGSKINDNIFDVHIEKALKEFDGAYSVINREFVKNELQSFEYINREDDLGLEGLRKAKLSYNPKILLKKFFVSQIG